MGPLWLSRGEGFSPSGVRDFLKGLIAYTKTKVKDARNYKKQLQLAQSEDSKGSVEIVALLSMTSREIDDALTIVSILIIMKLTMRSVSHYCKYINCCWNYKMNFQATLSIVILSKASANSA